MNITEKRVFNYFRIIALTALFCTIILWAGLWISSGIPSNKKLNSSLADSIDSSLDINNTMSTTNVTSYITFALEEGSSTFVGDKAKIVVNYYPQKTTDKDVEYISQDTSIATVDQDGYVTFLKQGLTKIEVRLKSNPSISYKRSYYCWGINPTTNQNNTFHVSGVSGDNQPLDTVRQYETRHAWVNNGKTDMHSVYKYYTQDENIATVDKSGIVTGRQLGNTTLYAEFRDGTVLSQSIEIVENNDYTPIEKINLKDFTLDVETLYYKINNLVDSFEPEPQGDYKPVIHVESSDKKIVYEQNEQLVVNGFGEVTLTFYSEFNPEIKTSVTTYVKPIQPEELRVSAPNVVAPQMNYILTASHMPQAYSTDVEWEVIEGHATITEKGLLMPTFWGDLVVRCRSKVDPTLYTDVTMKCQLFDNAYMFVRKLMGHFGLSALLGFGIFCTIFLLDKRKWMAFTATPVLSFAYAGISEFIQYFTPTRFCTITDVLIDFIGALIGMAVAMLIVALVTLIWRIASKKTFGAFKNTLNTLSLPNAKHKAYEADEYQREPIDTQENTAQLAS